LIAEFEIEELPMYLKIGASGRAHQSTNKFANPAIPQSFNNLKIQNPEI
jgi:hypothetical protein